MGMGGPTWSGGPTQILASASCCGNTAARCQIRIWDVPKGLCRHLLSHHDTAVQALAFSPDDEFLVTLGDYADRNLALWSMATYELLSSTRLLEPVHGVAFNPWDANELICVGTNAITFWLLQHHGADTCFQVHREPIPEELGASELTSLCYGASPLLYCGSSSGQSCLCLAWTPPSCELPEQQQVVAGYSDGTLRVFSISRTAMELKMHPHRTALTAIAFSTDGQTILSGDKDGLVAISHPCTGMTFRVLSDHRGAPISAIQSTSKEYGDLGVEGVELWLAASGDQRVSIWVSDWLRDRCELLEWLSFPAPAVSEAPGLLPPSLAAFCPWDKAILVCVGLGAHEEVIFYSLRQKQVIQKTPLPFFAMSLSLSPGSQLMVVGFAECMMRLLDCASGTAQDLEGHDDSVHLCRFTPSGRLLFTAAHNEILVWEVTDP